jgi:hypothetical protein
MSNPLNRLQKGSRWSKKIDAFVTLVARRSPHVAADLTLYASSLEASFSHFRQSLLTGPDAPKSMGTYNDYFTTLLEKLSAVLFLSNGNIPLLLAEHKAKLAQASRLLSAAAVMRQHLADVEARHVRLPSAGESLSVARGPQSHMVLPNGLVIDMRPPAGLYAGPVSRQRKLSSVLPPKHHDADRDDRDASCS